MSESKVKTIWTKSNELNKQFDCIIDSIIKELNKSEETEVELEQTAKLFICLNEIQLKNNDRFICNIMIDRIKQLNWDKWENWLHQFMLFIKDIIRDNKPKESIRKLVNGLNFYLNQDDRIEKLYLMEENESILNANKMLSKLYDEDIRIKRRKMAFLKTYNFYEKLNKIFKNNIELSYISDETIIIVTKEHKFYEFNRNAINNSSLIFSNNESIFNQKINASFIEELSGVGIHDIKHGIQHKVALNFDKNIYCWERNTYGMLGKIIEVEYSISNKSELNVLKDTHISQLSCGFGHSLALTNKGKVYAWGLNNMGQVGNGKCGILERESIPFLIEFNNEIVMSISCGLWHSLALTTSGRVFSWGNNCYGQLGRECREECEKNTPKLIQLESVIIKKICCGALHNLLLSSEGEIYVFGNNEKENLGLISKLKLIEYTKFTDISAYFKSNFSSALSEDGSYYIWEVNDMKIYNVLKNFEYKSFDPIFWNKFEITCNPVKNKIIKFNDNLLRSKYYATIFHKEKYLESGSYGCVFSVEFKNFPYEKRAIKKMELNISNNQEELKISSILKELDIFTNIKDLNNEKLVKYYDIWFENEPQKNGRYLIEFVYIEMELCHMSLEDFMVKLKNDKRLVNNNCLTIMGYYISSQLFIQILEGVDYLHQRNPKIIHRDLKPNNILLKVNVKSNSVVKIADFGFACLHKYEDQSHTTHKGHLRYIAPEIDENNTNTTKYGTKADIYSLGVVLKDLFQIDVKRDYNSYKDAILKDKYQELIELIINITTQFPIRRKSCEQILKEKDSWALNKKNFNIEKECEEFFKNNCKEKDNQIYIDILDKLIFTMHTSIQCDKCKDSTEMQCIKGIRYKCNVCENHNLCDSCYKEVNLKYLKSEHKFDKIYDVNDEEFNTLVKKIEDLSLNKESEVDYGSFNNSFKKIDITGLDDETKKHTLRELEFLIKLKNNDYIVQYKNVYVLNNEAIFIQTSFGMTLEDVISKQKNVNQTMSLTEYYISSELFREILECINYLHKIPIIHRALNPTNILIAHGTNNRFVKLSNFDSAVFHEYNNQSHTGFKNYTKYIAPELYQKEQTKQIKRIYDTKSDIYSLGIIAGQLFDMVDIDDDSAIQTISNPDLKKKYMFIFKSIIEMQDSLMKKRPDCQTLLSKQNQHHWSISNDELISDPQFKSILKSIPSMKNISIKESFSYYFLKTKFKIKQS